MVKERDSIYMCEHIQVSTHACVHVFCPIDFLLMIRKGLFQIQMRTRDLHRRWRLLSRRNCNEKIGREIVGKMNPMQYRKSRHSTFRGECWEMRLIRHTEGAHHAISWRPGQLFKLCSKQLRFTIILKMCWTKLNTQLHIEPDSQMHILSS